MTACIASYGPSDAITKKRRGMLVNRHSMPVTDTALVIKTLHCSSLPFTEYEDYNPTRPVTVVPTR